MLTVKIDSYKHTLKHGTFFSNVRFEIESNGFYLLAGVSGIGKSTLMKIILGIQDGDLKGDIVLNKGSKNYSPIELRRHGFVGYQSDEFSLIPWKTIGENINLPPMLNNQISKLDLDAIISELSLIGLDETILKKYPYELSFGMKSRVGIIRACLWSPCLVFLDELFSGIDLQNNELISRYLKTKSDDAIIIAISHQIDQALKIADGVLVINKNREVKIFESFDLNIISQAIN